MEQEWWSAYAADPYEETTADSLPVPPRRLRKEYRKSEAEVGLPLKTPTLPQKKYKSKPVIQQFKRRCFRCHGSGRASCQICAGSGEVLKGCSSTGAPVFGGCNGCMGTKLHRCAACGGEGFVI